MGIDTVRLDGKYFDVHVREGQKLKKGDCIMDADFKAISKEGYDTAVCLIFAEPADGFRMEREPERTVKPGDKIGEIIR